MLLPNHVFILYTLLRALSVIVANIKVETQDFASLRSNQTQDFASLHQNQTMLSLYLHIPFCQHRCSYCDFNTYTSLGDLQEVYARALADEVAAVAGNERRPVQTIFFGGGTPSLMSAASLDHILQAVHTHFDVAAAAEISMECNPGTISAAYFAQLRQLGINRLSFGVQSVVASELQLLGRTHTHDTVVTAVRLAQQAGFDDFNLDLIYGVPGQTLPSWETSVRTLLDLAPTHLSLYCLTVEPGTPMQSYIRTGKITPPDPDLAADQYELACQLMAEAGYDHYEISNWCKPGRECQHNLTYWRNGDYLGLGAGAHGHADGIRYHVVKQPRTYIKRIATPAATTFPLSPAVKAQYSLDQADQISDTVITQLRLLNEGLDMTAFEQRFGRTPQAHFGDTLTQLLDWEMVAIHDHQLRLTEKGVFLSNQVFHRLI